MAQGRIWLVAAAALALGGGVGAQPAGPTSGPGDGAAAAPPGDDVSSWDAGKRAAYNASFDKDTHDSCVSSAQGHGVQADAADRYCSCIVGRLQPLSVEAKVSLSQHPDVMQSAADSCKAQPSG